MLQAAEPKVNREFHNVNCRFCGVIHSADWANITALSQVTHKPIKSRLVRGRLYLPNQHHESHHKICDLRYGTYGYGMSAYKGGVD